MISSSWLIDEKFLKKHKIDLLVHGHDCSNPIEKGKKLFLKELKV